ncbi:hypothetical protein GH721_08890 [Kriegella sp. EG-1]|nr:hypothetical protein [Flavobacteriaceae bacterium EG-1]
MANSGLYSVNWVDGMKINKNHFIDMENSLLDKIRDSQHLNITPSNFGLLPMTSGHLSSLELTTSIDGQSTIEVTLHSCRAITLGGVLINISKAVSSMLEHSGHKLSQQIKVDKKDLAWYIVLIVNPLKKVAFGEANPDEVPPRHPHVLPEFRLDVIPVSETSKQELGLYHISIGKIVNKEDNLAVDLNFIPPCTSMQSHPDLKFVYNELGTFLNQMELFCIRIIQKIYQKKQTNDLANVALHLSQQMIQYLNAYLVEYRIVDKNEAPIKIISKIAGLARVIKSSLDVFEGTGKEDFVNYLAEWCDLRQGAIESVLIETIEINYVHTDINAAFQDLSEFTKLMLILFKKLNELDYIGKKPETGIFVKEETINNNEIKGRRNFLLD